MALSTLHSLSTTTLSCKPPPYSSTSPAPRLRFDFRRLPMLRSSSSSLPMLRSRRISFSAGRPRAGASAAVEESPASPVGENKYERRVGSDLPTLLRRFWKVAAPYWSSEDKVQARLRLAVVFTLTLGTAGINVWFNFLWRDFTNALANKNQEQFVRQLLYYLLAFASAILVFVLEGYLKATLSLRWRSWMTSYYMERYLKNRIFYKIQSQSIIDNPDQRIVDDLRSFADTSLTFSLILFNAVVELVSFSKILLGIYPPLFVVLVLYSIGGTAITVFLGKGLVNLNFMQKKKEADFRYGLVRVRENAESIAFYGGERNEMQLLLHRFRKAFENLSQLLISSRNLDFFTRGYYYLIQILPAAAVAPMYFSGKIEFGVINQSLSAFNQILSDFSLIVSEFQAISAFSAVINRLGEFDDVLDGSSSSFPYESQSNVKISIIPHSAQDFLIQQSNGREPPVGHQKLLEIQNLTLETPDTRRILIADLSLEINQKDHLLVMGPSGSGKTSLLRALAGLWNTGEGNILFYLEKTGKNQSNISSDEMVNGPNADAKIDGSTFGRDKGVFFLPQRPYMVLGTLREQLLYPTWSNNFQKKSENVQTTGSLPFLMQQSSLEGISEQMNMPMPTTDDLLRVLEAVRLGDIVSRFKGIDTVCEWSSVLSLGEQQRLAFARLLLSKPTLVLMDESTSALDDDNESHLYMQIEDAGMTYISIGHRRTLYKYHSSILRISGFPENGNHKKNWELESIDDSKFYRTSKLA